MTTWTPRPVSAFEYGRQGRDQRLALAGLHLGDLAAVEHHAADQLDVEVALAERAARGLAHHREGLGQHFIQRLVAFVVVFDRA